MITEKQLSQNPKSVAMREYIAKNKSRIVAQKKARYQRNRELMAQQHKAAMGRMLSTPEGRARQRERYMGYATRKRKEILDFFGNKCAHCGFDDPRVLQMDHIHGNGGEHRRNSSGGWNLGERYCAIKRRPEWVKENFQLLCANCNWIKRVENREYSNGLSKLRSSEEVRYA